MLGIVVRKVILLRVDYFRDEVIMVRDTDVIQHIEELRKERGWSYYRLAKEAELSMSTLSNMTARTNIPTIPTLKPSFFRIQLPVILQ